MMMKLAATLGLVAAAAGAPVPATVGDVDVARMWRELNAHCAKGEAIATFTLSAYNCGQTRASSRLRATCVELGAA